MSENTSNTQQINNHDKKQSFHFFYLIDEASTLIKSGVLSLST